MSDMSVPGGHIDCEPPQHPHKNPSIAQCLQYSQVEGAPGSAPPAGAAPPGLASAPRATGSSGTIPAPSSMEPRPASTLRRDVRRASDRAELSKNASNHFMTLLYGRLPMARSSLCDDRQIRLQVYIRPVVQTEVCWP